VLASRSDEEWRDQYQRSEECLQSHLTRALAAAHIAAASSGRRSLPETWRQLASWPPLRKSRISRPQDTEAGGGSKPAGRHSDGAGIRNGRKHRLEAVFSVIFPGYFVALVRPQQRGEGNCKRAADFRLERDVNLSVASHVLSKMALLSMVGLGQVMLLFLVASLFTGIPGGSGQIVAMSAFMLAGTSTGLLLSSVSRTNDQTSCGPV